MKSLSFTSPTVDDEVFALGDRVIILDKGNLVAQGTPHEVMRAPRLETVAALTGFENVFDVVVSSIRRSRDNDMFAGGSLSGHPKLLWFKLRWGLRFRLAFGRGHIFSRTSHPTG